MRIAIIEDDEITRLELSKLLKTQGYETVLLTDFEHLTEELKQYSAELVLLDINLPYENGYEVCRNIKQVMPVPIIFVTSRDTNEDELKSIQVGGIDFITKPYDTLILLEKIKRALQLILSRLVDTFFSRISLTMQPPPKPHSTACVLPWEEGRHWQSRSSGCSSS